MLAVGGEHDQGSTGTWWETRTSPKSSPCWGWKMLSGGGGILAASGVLRAQLPMGSSHPLLLLLLQVTELKSLANHVVVGNVSCETKDLFAALPQVVAVDINDLGTLKLSLEVTWK